MSIDEHRDRRIDRLAWSCLAVTFLSGGSLALATNLEHRLLAIASLVLFFPAFFLGIPLAFYLFVDNALYLAGKPSLTKLLRFRRGTKP
jgi:hypothetical protein